MVSNIQEAPFPHCDQRVLHAPKVCKYCDERSDLQELREAWGINFTGENDPKKQPCPATAVRDTEVIYKWSGNRAVPHDTILKKALDFLEEAGYTRVGLWTSNDHIKSLLGLSTEYNWNRVRETLTKGKMVVTIFNEDRITNLRGPQFEAFIIQGKVETIVEEMIGYGLRLGESPIKIKI